jgi:hypothetical protein
MRLPCPETGEASKDSSRAAVWLVSLDHVGFREPAAKDQHYRMLQHDKHFEPTMLVIPVGGVVDFPNLDPWFHNVFSLYRGKRFDLGLYQAGSQRSVHFDKLNSTAWWYDDGRLYWIIVRPLVAGGGSERKELGLIVAGYQLDSRVAEQLARVTGGEIALTSGGRVIASTLSPAGASELAAQIAGRSLNWAAEARDISLGQSRYEIASVLLQSGFPTPVQCYVLMPLERAASFMRRLNRTILVLGIAAIGITAIFALSFQGRSRGL